MHTCILDNAMYPTWIHKSPGFQPANPVKNNNDSASWQQLCITVSTKQNAPGSIPPARRWGWIHGWCKTHPISSIWIVVYQVKPAGNPPNLFVPDVSPGLETALRATPGVTSLKSIFHFLECINILTLTSPSLLHPSAGHLGAHLLPGLGAEDGSSCLHCTVPLQLPPSCQTLLSHGHPPCGGSCMKGAWNIMIQCHVLVLCRLPSWRH